MKNKEFLVLGAIMVFGLALVLFFYFYPIKKENLNVVLANKTFETEVADTVDLQEKGLSGHVPLLDNQGMLFVFKKADTYGFWMKDMTFPIDILWVSEGKKIVHIERSLTPDSFPKVFYPTGPSLYVFEISAGQSDLLNLKIGDSVKFINN
ncbi:DUF192 domain-containing protein [Patescibacteria group bacterium]|nr:DUF192 domain-containing protein [Patescibacteria group bacterium]